MIVSGVSARKGSTPCVTAISPTPPGMPTLRRTSTTGSCSRALLQSAFMCLALAACQPDTGQRQALTPDAVTAADRTPAAATSGDTATAATRRPVPVQLPPVAFITTDGTAINPDTYRGKALLVNFWSPTCSVCMREMPLLQNVQTEYASKGLVLVAASMPYDRPSDAVELKQLRNWSFAVAIDPQGKTSQAFGDVKATPLTVLYDRQGRLVWQHAGELQEQELKQKTELALHGR